MDDLEPSFATQVLHALLFVLYLALAGATLATLLGWLSRWFWPGEMASHFRVQYFWVCLIALVVLAASRQWLATSVAGVAALLNLAVILPLYLPRSTVPDEGPTLRVASINVLSTNRRHDEVLALIRATRPNVVLLMEVTDAWRDVLEALRDEYPYGKAAPRPDNFGIALLSRIPLDDIQVREFDEAEVPSIVATLEWSGERLTLIGTHPLNPGSIGGWRLRNDQFRALAEFCRSTTGPVILAGDLNSTSWSAHFDTLLDGTRLRDSRAGFGVQVSWPTWPVLLRIPIDHCLVSPELAVRDRVIGPSTGSDHYPLVVDLVLNPQLIQRAEADDAPAARP